MAHRIETEVLTKFYGSQRGVENPDPGCGPGEVFGFLGPNGAGKTTTIQLLADLIGPTRSTIRVLGQDLRRDPVAAGRAALAEAGSRGEAESEIFLWARLSRLAMRPTKRSASHAAETPARCAGTCTGSRR